MIRPPRSGSRQRRSRASGPWLADGSAASWRGAARRCVARVRQPSDATCVDRQVSRQGDARQAVRSPPMTPERWRLVKAIVQAALERPVAARPAFVVEACGDDAALRSEVSSLLTGPDTGERSDGFLASPAVAR